MFTGNGIVYVDPPNKIRLSVYDGSHLSWLTWINQFHDMIHSRKIRPSQKLGFLYEHLCSFAQEILGRSGNSEMDYRKALLKLQKLFGNVGDVYTALSTRINHLECNSRDFNSLLTFASKLNSLADQFIQVSGGDNGKSMISGLLSKLSRNDQAEWNGLLARGLLLDGIISFSEWLLNKVLLQRNCYITTMGEMGTAVERKKYGHSEDSRSGTKRFKSQVNESDANVKTKSSSEKCLCCNSLPHPFVTVWNSPILTTPVCGAEH